MNDFSSHAADLPAPTRFDWIADGIAFGADYNPEQWPEELWPEDIALMQRAGVTSVSLGIFSWGLLETADGVWDWGWLDRIMDLLHDGAIGVNLATPTAAPPIWLLRAHPEIATVDADGHRTAQGGRLAWSPSSAVFRRYALRLVRAIAERYGTHPALRMWHVSNEIGNENGRCYSEETGAAFRVWLAERFGDVSRLNAAWGTAFWGHHYTSFDQVEPPRGARTGHNPGLLLDFERFTSDALIAHYRAERDELRRITPRIPITTNFMVMNTPGATDHEVWAREVDIVANDHYTIGADPFRHSELAFSADRVRGLVDGRPWMLMEHSTAAVNWQGVNRAKSAGEMARDSLAHVARGSDGILFFQWRASTAGAEQYHSAMVPHAGADSTIFRDVERLGATLKALAPVRGTRVEKARVALLFDHDAVAALRSGRKPSDLVDPMDMPIAVHRALTLRGIAVDVLPSSADLNGYAAVIVPTLYLTDDALPARLERLADGGAHVLVTYLSGIVDPENRVRSGGYPGAFRELLGIRVDEFFPLMAGESVSLDTGHSASVWLENVDARDAEVRARVTSGERSGIPTWTRRALGRGSASYLATRPDTEGLDAVLSDVLDAAGVVPVVASEPGLDVIRRVGDGSSYLFLINHTDAERSASASGRDLMTGERYDGTVRVASGAVVVVEEER